MKLHIKPSGIKNKPFELTKPFKCVLSNGDTMYIPAGYWTDFASVPKLLRIFIDHIGKDSHAFLLHDYLYNFRGYRTNGRGKDRSPIKVTRKFADDEMAFHMLEVGSSSWRITCFWLAVRLFGWLRFGKI